VFVQSTALHLRDLVAIPVSAEFPREV